MTRNIHEEIAALDGLVDAFAADMKRKLQQKAREGQRGWDDLANTESNRRAIPHCVGRREWVNVANYAMFQHAIEERNKLALLCRVEGETISQ